MTTRNGRYCPSGRRWLVEIVHASEYRLIPLYPVQPVTELPGLQRVEQAGSRCFSEWKTTIFSSWEGRQYGTSTWTMQKVKPFIQNGTILNLEQASFCDIVAARMHHTGFLLVLEVVYSLICEVLDRNSGSVIHLLQLLATAAMKHTYMHHSTVSRRSPLFCSD